MRLSLSPSKKRKWDTCRLQWWFDYVAKALVPNVEPWPLVRGTAAHAGLATAYRLAAAEQLPPPPGRRMSHYEDAALDAFHAALTPPYANRTDRIEAAGVLIELLATLPVPAPRAIVGVEQPFRLETPGGVIEGVIDLALRTGPRSLHIRDWKWSYTPEPEDSSQGATYNIAAPTLWDWAEQITIGFYSIKNRTERPVELDPEVRQLRLEQLEYSGLEMADAMRMAAQSDIAAAEVFPPTLGEHCESCLFRAYCPAYGGPPSALTYPVDDVASTRADLIRKLNTK